MNTTLGSDFEAEVVSRLPEAIRSLLPIEVELLGRAPEPFADFEFQFSGPGLKKTVWVEARAGGIPPSSIEALSERARKVREVMPDHILLLLAPSIDERTRKRLRDFNLNHADLSGTLYIQEPGLVVRVDGPKAAAPRRSVKAGFNPFADKASLILRALMRTPSRGWGVRELADELGVSVGLVSMTVDEIVRRGYAVVDEGKASLCDPASALIDWAAVPSWRYSKILSFQVPFEPDEMLESAVPAVLGAIEGPAALTQLSGLDLYAPHVHDHGQVHLYLPAEAMPAVAAVVESRAYGEAVKSGGNFHLVQPSAKASTFFDSRTIAGLPVVSPVQLFLDLVEYPTRGLEGATMLLRTVLAEELGLDREQVARVASVLE